MKERIGKKIGVERDGLVGSLDLLVDVIKLSLLDVC